MASILNQKFLDKLGVTNLPADEQGGYLRDFFTTLDMRVNIRLATGLDDAQLKQLQGYIESGNDEEALKFVTGVYPNFREIVQEEVDKLVDEINQGTDDIMKLVDEAENDEPAN